MKISIAMTTYNGEHFLREQLDSILAQSISDWELIVCDDCSLDSTWSILQEYELKDSRINIFKNESNLGFVKNFEKAVSLCKGNYIALCDQDDIWEKNHLELLLNSMETSIGSVGNARMIDENGNKTNDLISERERYFSDGDDCSKLFRILFYGNPFQGASSLFKKEFFDKALPIPNGVEYHDSWFNAVSCCLAGLIFVPEVVNNYRIHGNNASGNHNLSFKEQMKLTLNRKGWQTDRIIYCNELIARIPNMPEEKKNIVLMAKQFHENRVKGRRLKTVYTVLKYYKKIYSTNNYKQAFSRCIGILLKG